MIKILTKKQYKEIENTIEKCVETNQRLNRELKESDEFVNKYVRRMGEHKNRIKELQVENENLTHDLVGYEKDLEFNKDRLSAQEKEIDKLRDTNKKLRLENQTLITDLNTAKKELEETKKQLEQKKQKKNNKAVKEEIVGLTPEEYDKILTDALKGVTKPLVDKATNEPKTKKTSRKVKGDK